MRTKQQLLEETIHNFFSECIDFSNPEILKAIVDKSHSGIGTTVYEKVDSIDSLIALCKLQKEQSAGMKLSFKTTPISSYLSDDENTTSVAKECTIYLDGGSEIIEVYLRISVVLEFKKDKWLVVHWHASVPDAAHDEQDTFGFEALKQKNIALEKEVALRTAELVVKNRELAIEAALERVRSRSMAMQSTEDLAEVSALLDGEVRGLGIATRGCAFNIYGENDSTEWFSSEMGTLPTYKTPREYVFKTYYEAGENGEKLLVKEFDEQTCPAHYEFLCTVPVMGDALKQMIASGGSFPKRQIDHVAFFKYGYLLFITLEQVPEEHEIFIRFANAFEQTYTRFLDLQKAEAQAKQANQDLIEIKAARKEAEETLAVLKSTQTQLIQSEKMASLGELTAGIAHEIQNPLNFVNNFSEVSAEMIEEMQEEIQKGDYEEAKAISDDIKQNLEKITHHGQRASSIVKGMLEHSRTSSGQKELTDINALADEYLRLAYHGLRAKESSFNADFTTDFDPNLPKIEVIPQDIGRVLLNLINNGFQAIAEQSKKGLEGYKPTLIVSTKTENGQVLISVKDNGPGIPDAIKDKIFQPFFTTKPTGQGTGLGLSLVYDIVVAHGGELRVETKVEEGAEFTISLPIYK